MIASSRELMKGKKGSSRRSACRSRLPTLLWRLACRSKLPALIAAILFLFIRGLLSPSISCFGWMMEPRSGGNHATQEIGKQVSRVFLDEGNDSILDSKTVDDTPDTWEKLIQNHHLNVKSFALMAKETLFKMDHKVKSARNQMSIYHQLASIGIPRSMNCISLLLAEEYTVNSLARTCLPPPELACCLTNSSYIHLALLTDNVLAASVVVSSMVSATANPEKLVFHIVTDKKTYTAMHTWFALHPVAPAILEVKSLHNFDWPSHLTYMRAKMAKELQRGARAYRYYMRTNDKYMKVQALKPSSFSLLNHFRMHLPDLFPGLNKVIFLDDDVVVQHDISQLWYLDLSGKVNGAVTAHKNCMGKELGIFLNFSSPHISTLGMEQEQCSWLGGLNVFNLQAWRRTNITKVYHQWLKLNRISGFTLFDVGFLPPAFIAFDGQVESIDSSWLLSDLGWRMPEAKQLESSAVLHFNGPRKPWLEIGIYEPGRVWRSHIKYSNHFIRSCRLIEQN